MILRYPRIPIAHATLHLGGAGDRVHDTGKLHQHAVAGLFDNSPLMLADFGIKEIGLQRVQCGECTGLIRTHEAAVSNNVGGKNSGQAAFHMGTHKSAREYDHARLPLKLVASYGESTHQISTSEIFVVSFPSRRMIIIDAQPEFWRSARLRERYCRTE